MQIMMRQHKDVALQSVQQIQRTNRQEMNAMVQNRGRWSLHLFPLLVVVTRFLDGSHARFLRPNWKVPTSFASRVNL